MSLQPLEHPGGLRVLRAAGELDVQVVPALLSAVPGLVAGAPSVVLDLTDVTFLDSSGVRLVDRLTRECGQAGAAFRVVAPRGNRARRVLELVGLAGLLTDDLPAGVAQGATSPDGTTRPTAGERRANG